MVKCDKSFFTIYSPCKVLTYFFRRAGSIFACCILPGAPKNQKNSDASLEKTACFCYTLYKSAKSRIELLKKLFNFADVTREYVRIQCFPLLNFIVSLNHDVTREYVRIQCF